MASKVGTYFRLLKDAGIEFSNDNATKLCASLAYYTVFAIGPLLLVVISLIGLFFEKQQVTSQIYTQLNSFLGKNGADQMLAIIQNMQQQNAAAKYGIIGSIFLVIGATGVFAEIQDSINYIWSVKAKPKRGWVKYITNRLLSFSLIIGIGFLLIVSLGVNVLVDLLTDRLQAQFASVTVVLFKVLNVAFLFVVTDVLFAVIYKVLPDARIRWKDAFIGASFTSVLFMLGKLLIGIYLSKSNFSATYGPAATVIILISWIYYSAIILYFGAEFTKVFALEVGGGIKPYDNAVFIVKKEAKEMPPLAEKTD